MNNKVVFFLVIGFLLACSMNSFGQSRSIGAQSIVLDDGAGHTVTIQVANPAGGTFTFPAGGGIVATQGFLTGNYLPLAGGTLTGALNGTTIGGTTISGTLLRGIGAAPSAATSGARLQLAGSSGSTWNYGVSETVGAGNGFIESNFDQFSIYLDEDLSNLPLTAFSIYRGLRDAAPAQLLKVDGNGNLTSAGTATANGVSIGSVFNVNSTGNITKLNNVTTSFPAAQGGASTVLTNDGSGNLSWQSSGGFTPSYLNVYINSAVTPIPPGSAVPLLTISANSGFTPFGLFGFIASTTGVYNVEYTVAKNEAGGFALTVNGSVQTISKFSCATGTTVIHGNAILTLVAGDDLQLIASPDNATAITLEITPGAPPAVQASMTVIQIH